MKKARIPIKLINRILKENGAERVSKEAKEELASKLKEIADNISKIVIRNAMHSGRKLITKEDILEAEKRIR